MGADKETKERLLASAKSEFMEKGYTKASLRKICANADVTTGALYFFFKDKEDLFCSIVEKPLQALIEIIQTHFAEDARMFAVSNGYEHEEGDHNEIAIMLIHHLYTNYDTFILLLTKSQGTCYENCVDHIVDMIEQSYTIMAENLAKQSHGMKVNSYITHWFNHRNLTGERATV